MSTLFGVLDGNHLERVLAIPVTQGEILAGCEHVRAKAVTRLIIVASLLVIVEDPARVLASARLVHQTANLVPLAFPESPHAAAITAFLSKPLIDVPLPIEGSNQLIAALRRTGREFPGAGQMKADSSLIDAECS